MLNKAETKFAEESLNQGLSRYLTAMCIWFCRVQRIEPNFDTLEGIRMEVSRAHLGEPEEK